MEINCAQFAHFVEAIAFDVFEKVFSGLALDVEHILEAVIKIDFSPAKSIYYIIRNKAHTCSKAFQNFVLGRCPSPVL